MDEQGLLTRVRALLALPSEPAGGAPEREPDADFNWPVDGGLYRLRLWHHAGGVLAVAQTADREGDWGPPSCIQVAGRDAVRLTKEIAALVG